MRFQSVYQGLSYLLGPELTFFSLKHREQSQVLLSFFGCLLYHTTKNYQIIQKGNQRGVSSLFPYTSLFSKMLATQILVILNPNSNFCLLNAMRSSKLCLYFSSQQLLFFTGFSAFCPVLLKNCHMSQGQKQQSDCWDHLSELQNFGPSSCELRGSSLLASNNFFPQILLRFSSYQLTQKYIAAAAKSLQSCLTLCDPIDGSPPGSAVPGILQA